MSHTSTWYSVEGLPCGVFNRTGPYENTLHIPTGLLSSPNSVDDGRHLHGVASSRASGLYDLQVTYRYTDYEGNLEGAVFVVNSRRVYTFASYRHTVSVLEVIRRIVRLRT